MIFLYSSSLSSCHLFLISSVLLIPYIFCPLLCPSCMKYSLGVSNVLEEVSAAAAMLLQSCPTLCDPIDGSPQGSPLPGILQARTLEWVVVFFSNAWKWKVKVTSLSRVWLLATPWTAAYQAPPSMGFSRQEYWSGVPLCVWYVGKKKDICEPICRDGLETQT